jgi:hypothetical protein
MVEIAPSSTVDILRYLQDKLDMHFGRLHEQRKSLEPVAPVFALEHDMGEVDRELLTGSVQSAIAHGMGVRYRAQWLPFIVYAAESGYDYVGDDYWPSFEQSAPGWRVDQRHWIKDWFVKFANEYGGAVPTGAFATNFSIIAWPITHAVLPAYLQRQLAQLLFEFSGGLSAALLSDPDELGVRLASRASLYSDRFRIFCQNTTLLGKVAAALLSGEDDDSPYLVKSALSRLLEGLSKERLSREWLSSARQAASRVRATGFKRQGTGIGPGAQQRRQSVPTDPKFFLRYLDGAWNAYAELADLSRLSERLPRVYEELRTLRGKVVGGRRPVPTGGLVYGGQEVRFETWPNPATPFLQLERGTDPVNTILADQCVMTPGPWWLYRRKGEGLAVEVKGSFLRPGHRYILVGSDEQDAPAVSWCVPVSLRATGVNAYRLDVPMQLTEAEAALIVARGLSVLSAVAIRPVGIVASDWDGEGAVEWLAREPAVVGIRSEVAPTRCLATIDGNHHLIPWPEGELELILSVDELPVGCHELKVTILGANGQELTTGSLAISIREPEYRPDYGTIGEGLRMISSPARPTFAELWDERASITIFGPPDADVELFVSMFGIDGTKLAMIRRRVVLPVDKKKWLASSRSIRSDLQLRDSYDEAETCVLAVRRGGMGMASLTCERGFQPLRWRFSKRRDGTRQATLHDRADGGNTGIDLFTVDAPLMSTACDPCAPVALPHRGGLLRATSGEVEALAIAPTNPNVIMTLGAARPRVPYGEKSIGEIMNLVEAHRMWATAVLPADPFAANEQRLVLEAIARANAMLIGGAHWAGLERKLERSHDPADHLEEMQSAIGISPAHKSLAAEIRRNLYRWLEPEALLQGFSDIIASTLVDRAIDNQRSTARFLLALAVYPGIVTEYPVDDRDFLLKRIVEAPVLLRAARFAAIGTSSLNASDTAERAD